MANLSEYELERMAKIAHIQTHWAFRDATKHARDAEAQSRAKKEAATKRRRGEKLKDTWLRCCKGHLLAPTTFAPNITCDGCEKRAKPRKTGFACSECDYDMCAECAQKSGRQTQRRSTRGSTQDPPGAKLLSLGQIPLSPDQKRARRGSGGGSSIVRSGGGSGEDEAGDEADKGHSWDELKAAFAAVRGDWSAEHKQYHSNVCFGNETKFTCQVCLTKLKGAKDRYCVTITKGLHTQLEKSTKKVGRLQLTSAERLDQKAKSHHGRHDYYVVASSKKIPAATLAAEVCSAREQME